MASLDDVMPPPNVRDLVHDIINGLILVAAVGLDGTKAKLEVTGE